jgi:anhydro-N-acetylmuramic acid kinase
MDSIINLSRKKKKKVISLMSGTSVDGIDAVFVELTGSGVDTNVKQIAFQTIPYGPKLKDFVIKNSNADTARLDDVVRLNILLGEHFADAVYRIIRKVGLKNKDIDLIGSHGHTIHHLPDRKNVFGKNISSTFQIGDPTVIAKRTGIITVGDFRIADVAVGGSGAPLVPYFDYIMFRSKKFNRGLLNIGGIANVTVVPKNAKADDVFAFDTGPGNMLIDNLMKRLFNKSYDEYGKIAFQGNIIPEFLKWMTDNSYFKKLPPKSTGREMFGDDFVNRILKIFKKYSSEDIISTVTELSPFSIYESYMKFIKRKVILDEVIVSGGGVHNLYLMDALQRYFGSVKVKTIESIGYSSDAKEAICFAVLANETIHENPSNIIGATGAKKQTALGKICLP